MPKIGAVRIVHVGYSQYVEAVWRGKRGGGWLIVRTFWDQKRAARELAANTAAAEMWAAIEKARAARVAP